jgi:hypothetical protein
MLNSLSKRASNEENELGFVKPEHRKTGFGSLCGLTQCET